MMWSQWYDHINSYKWNKSFAQVSVFNGCLKSQQVPDHIILIWSHWYDHIILYKLMEPIALTSVLDNCLDSLQELCHIISIWSNYIDMITVWSNWYDYVDMTLSIWMVFSLWRSNGKWDNLFLLSSYIPLWYK